MARRRYQKGSLKLVGDNWQARYREDVAGPDGKVRRIRRQLRFEKSRFPTKRLAQREFDLVLDRINDPKIGARRVSTFRLFVERWKTLVLPHKKPSTQRVSLCYLNKYLMPAFSEMNMEAIGDEDAQRLITEMSEKVGRQTVVNTISTLSGILTTARDWGYCSQRLNWRRLTMPRRTEQAMRPFFTAEQVRSIIELAEKKWPGGEWSTFFAIAAMTGMRAGELVALKATDFDLEQGLVFVRRSAWLGHVGTVKSKAGQRVLPLPASLLARVKRYLVTWKPNRDDWMFATRTGQPVMIGFVVRRRLQVLLDELKIKRCGLHAFRHAHASMLVASGAPLTVARDQLGHSDMRLTLGVYSHVIGNARREAIEKMACLLDADGRDKSESGKYIS